MASKSKVRLPVGAPAAFTLVFAALAAGLASGPAHAQQQGRQASAPIVYAGASSISTPIDLRPGAAPAGTANVLAAGRSPAMVLPAEAPAGTGAQPYAGPPYQVEGRWYVPMHEPDYNEIGVASWYGPNFHGKLSSTGETYDQYAMTAAHPTLPIPSMVRVTNLENGKTVTVRLNDRGPFIDDRIIDLSRAAAESIDMTRKGTAKVRVEYLGPANGGEEQPEALLAKYVPPAGAAPAVAATPLAPMELAPKWQASEAPAQAEGGFFLQAGSFADLANAHKLKASLASYGSVAVRSVMVGGSEYYRVVLGPWASREAAGAVRDRLAAAGSSTILLDETR